MGALIVNWENMMMLNMTCPMKDADRALEVFRKHNIHFEKKFTTMHGQGTPSTITFVDLTPTEMQKDLACAITDLNNLAQMNQVGNIYISVRRKQAEGASGGRRARTGKFIPVNVLAGDEHIQKAIGHTAYLKYRNGTPVKDENGFTHIAYHQAPLTADSDPTE